MRLKDKVALVTGGGRGIGRDIALAYAKEGAHVVVAEIDPATAKATSADIAKTGVRSIGVATDVSKSADIARLVMTVAKELRRSSKRYGLATQCIGAGQGISTIVEAMG